MTLSLTHQFHSHLDLSYDNRLLFRYVYQPDTDPVEAIKPYFHPLYTLSGDLVTIFRPYDHLWHHGLAMTMAALSGQNFWGGPTYVRGKGYVQLPNNGRQQHVRWQRLECEPETATFIETLHWITHDDVHWLIEERRIEVNEVNVEAGYWSLNLSFALKNIHSAALAFGSPTTEGRPMAGYGSLFWRGPRSFLNGQVLASDNLEGPEVMGRSSPWLAYIGRHDGSNNTSTLLFIDQPGNPRYPNKWFLRNDPFAAVSFSFMFDQTFDLPVNETLTLNYQILLINGPWSRSQIESFVADQGG